MARDKVNFINTRARFQSLSTAKLFVGWVESLSPKSVLVSSATPLKAAFGDKFRFEVYGHRVLAVFEAQLEIVSGTNAAFSLCSSIRAVSSTEEMRLKLDHAHASVFAVPSEGPAAAGNPVFEEVFLGEACSPLAEGEVADGSEQGLGFLSSAALEKGAKHRILIQTHWGPVECLCKVQNCRPTGGGFRIGFSILAMDRLNRGIYRRLLERTAAAA